MKSILNNVTHNLKARFSVSEITEQQENLVFVTVPKEQTIALLTHMRDQEGFSHFVMMSVVDWIEEGYFQMTYILNHPDEHVDLAIRTKIGRENAQMESAHHLWQQIATHQREFYEMYGIDFPNSPRVHEEFLLEGWDEIPPMRREFDTKKYSEETFFPRPGRKSKNPKEQMKNKLYPDAFK